MRVQEAMTTYVQVVQANAPVQEAAQRMREASVGILPVCDRNRLVGVITDRDIAIRSTASGEDPRQTRVAEVMTPHVVYCNEDVLVDEAARQMQSHHVRRLIVLDDDKNLVGVLSLGDLALETHDGEMTGQTLECMAELDRMGV